MYIFEIFLPWAFVAAGLVDYKINYNDNKLMNYL